jgi:uncharacterized protein with von Willebrand factor type A (vWA) domain
MRAGGAVEYNNEEAGSVWLERVSRTWPHMVWLNPLPREQWNYTQSISMIERAVEGRMFPLTLEGLEQAMRELVR